MEHSRLRRLRHSERNRKAAVHVRRRLHRRRLHVHRVWRKRVHGSLERHHRRGGIHFLRFCGKRSFFLHRLERRIGTDRRGIVIPVLLPALRIHSTPPTDWPVCDARRNCRQDDDCTSCADTSRPRRITQRAAQIPYGRSLHIQDSDNACKCIGCTRDTWIFVFPLRNSHRSRRSYLLSWNRQTTWINAQAIKLRMVPSTQALQRKKDNRQRCLCCVSCFECHLYFDSFLFLPSHQVYAHAYTFSPILLSTNIHYQPLN